MNIYVASSWRNVYQEQVVAFLRGLRHEVYDFKNPAAGRKGFGWHEIDPLWQSWTASQWRDALSHPLAIEGFKQDFAAMRWADACVLVLPCGRSAHLEAGWFTGQLKPVYFLALEPTEPELMVGLGTAVCTSFHELADRVGLVKA